MVAEVRAGVSLRAVARAHRVSLSTVQWWMPHPSATPFLLGGMPISKRGPPERWSSFAGPPRPGRCACSAAPSTLTRAGPTGWCAARSISAPRRFASTRCAGGTPITSRCCARPRTSSPTSPFGSDRDAMTPPSKRPFADREGLAPGRSGAHNGPLRNHAVVDRETLANPGERLHGGAL